MLPMNQDRIGQKIGELEQEKHQLKHRLEILDAQILILQSVQLAPRASSGLNLDTNGASNGDHVPLLKDAADSVMKSFGKPFTEREVENAVRERYPNLTFAAGSIRKPMRKARDAGRIKVIEANKGNLSQTTYEWNDAK